MNTWQLIKQVNNNNQSFKSIIKEINVNNKTIKDRRQMAENVNEYFVKIGPL